MFSVLRVDPEKLLFLNSISVQHPLQPRPRPRRGGRRQRRGRHQEDEEDRLPAPAGRGPEQERALPILRQCRRQPAQEKAHGSEAKIAVIFQIKNLIRLDKPLLQSREYMLP